MCDVIIATNDSDMGVGRPAMIEGGGLGVHAVEDIGPAAMHAVTGAVNIVVPDDATAVATAHRFLFILPGPQRRRPRTQPGHPALGDTREPGTRL